MPLPSSGAISLNDIHIEAGGTTGTTASINDSDIRALINKSSGATMSFSEWYGASADQDASLVGTTSNTFNSTTGLLNLDEDDPIDLTGQNIQVGDLVVIAVAADRNLEQNAPFTGMTLSNALGTGVHNDPGRVVKYGYWQSGDSNPYYTGTNNYGGPLCLVAAIFRDTNTSLLNSAESTGISGNPDPPSLASASGSKLIVATGHLDDDRVTFTAGSGYTMAVQADAGQFAKCSVAIKYKIVSSDATENPPGFSSGGSDQWFASTLRF